MKALEGVHLLITSMRKATFDSEYFIIIHMI